MEKKREKERKKEREKEREYEREREKEREREGGGGWSTYHRYLSIICKLCTVTCHSERVSKHRLAFYPLSDNDTVRTVAPISDYQVDNSEVDLTFYLYSIHPVMV